VAAAGCATIPDGRYAVSSVEIEGAEQMDDRAVENCLATYERPAFQLDLGANPDPECGVPPFDTNRLSLRFWRWPWTDWPIFDRSTFDRDTERIERWYRARGFYDARVLSTTVDPPQAMMSRFELEQSELEPCEEDCEVDVTVQVFEGEPVTIRSIKVEGHHSLPEDVRADIEDAITLESGERFDEAIYDQAKRDVAVRLADASYAHGQVRGEVDIDPVGHTADIRLQIDPGPPCVFGDVTIVDNENLDAEVIEAVALLEPGEAYSNHAIAEAQRAIYVLGAFASVAVRPKLPEDRTDRVIPIEVSAVPGRLTRWGLGAGIQAGVLNLLGSEQQSIPQWDVHLLLPLAEFRNFLGGLRRLRLEERPRLIFQEQFPGIEVPRPGNNLKLRFRQPSFIEPRTWLVAGAEWDLGPDPFQGFFRHDVNAELGPERFFFDQRLLLALRLRYNFYYPLDSERERAAEDPELFPGEIPSSYQLPFLELFGKLDLRDVPRQPKEGFYFQAGIHGAGPLASWSYFRLTPEVRGYVPLPLGIVLAMRFAIGAIFILEADSDLDETSQRLGPNRYRLRGGGATSVRGYLPGQLGDSVNGGVRRWEASLELRFPLSPDFSTVLFADVGDVHAGRGPSDPLGPEDPRFRFDFWHLSAGIGLRYLTIVGPLRLDIGFQIPDAQVLGQDDQIAIGIPKSRLNFIFAEVPGALHLTIGEAF
jgi:outer membrane translocation and assembly module TamA